MKRKNLVLLGLIFFLLNSSCFATRVEGIIANENKEPLPFCNVYIKSTNYACASNDDGYFSLNVEPGNYVIVFQYIGYTRQEIALTVKQEPIRIDIIMISEITALDEVVIKSDKEDPAYAVLRKAIEGRSNHLKEIGTYSCEVYIKGLQKFTEAPDKLFGVELNTILDVDSNNTGIIYLSESVSTFYYQYPDRTKEIMKASIVSGDKGSFSWNDAASMQMNFYENLETLQGFSQRGFVSPIAENAMLFYTYKLMSSVFENNHEIFKIRVTPKRDSDPAYNGIVYITDDDYRFTGLQLTLFKDNGLEFIDTFRVEQEYFYVDDEHLALLSNKFNFNYSLFGIKGLGFFHAFYKDYTINPVFTKNFFTAEVTKIEEGSNKKDSIYWSNTRPIQLTPEETVDYHQKDSLQILKETPAYQDSVDRIYNKFSVGDLISGYNFRKSKQHLYINTNPLPEVLQFNTVEGYVINLSARIYKEWDSKDHLIFTPNIRYGFGAQSLFTNAYLGYTYNIFSKATIGIAGGTNVKQFNDEGIPPLVNSLYSLIVEENYLKLYSAKYLSAIYSKEITNGLSGEINGSFISRNYLNNLPSADAWIDYLDKNFTPNSYPFSDEITDTDFKDKFSVGLKLHYQIKQQYIMQPDQKFILDSKYPRLDFNYEKAISGVFENTVQFDKLEFAIYDNVKLGLAGNLQYQGGAGLLIAKNQLPVADRFNFAGNETIISRTKPNSYFLLPYYTALSNEYYFSGHLEWHTEGFLFRKLPLFKQLKFEPVFSAQYLQTDVLNNYVEFSAGIEHIFKIARIDFAYTPNHFDASYPSERMRLLFGIGF